MEKERKKERKKERSEQNQYYQVRIDDDDDDFSDLCWGIQPPKQYIFWIIIKTENIFR